MQDINKSVAFHTLGCKLNFSETSAIARLFAEKGFTKKDFSEAADVYVINTCSVTENADKETRQIVKNALKKNPEAFIAIVGCYAQLKPNEIAKIKGVDVVLGAAEKFKLLNYIDLADKNTHAIIRNCEIDDVNFFVDAYSVGDRTRSFLKVQDGCDYSCTFCTIPLARGKSRSDTIENILSNVNKIAATGVKEVVLTGVNIGDFGHGQFIEENRKKREATFFDLIKKLDDVDDKVRFRISSIEPNLLTNEIIEFVATSKKFVPHFHIPLQSGSNTILKKMKRRYLRELYLERVKTVKKQMPHCCIGVDVLVGFPGETEHEFNDTYHFLNELDVSYLHVFTYSERDNTEAIKLEGVVPLEIRKQRNKMLRILSAKKLRCFYEQNIGKTFTALLEQENKNGYIHGFTENYIKVQIPFSPELINTSVQVKISGFAEDGSMQTEENLKLQKN